MEESLSSEDELSENSKADVNTATTASATGSKGKRKHSANVCFHLSAPATGGKGKRKHSANVCFHLSAFTFMKIKT